MVLRLQGIGLVGVLLLAGLAGCGGGEGGSGERPTITASLSPTRTLPTRTQEPTSEPTDSPTPSPTEAPTTPEPPESSEPEPEETTESSPTSEPEPTPTEPEETSEPGPTEPSASPSESEPAAGDESEDDGVPAWVWWLLAGVLLAGAILGGVLLARARRRRQWRERLQAAETEVAWLARELLPQLRTTGTLEGVAGGWQVSRLRVTALEDELTILEASATSDSDTVRARTLRDAVRAAGARLDRLTAAGPHDTWVLDLDEVIALLEGALTTDRQAQG